MRSLLPWLFAASLFPAFASANPPNIIFILSDDHRYDLMGFHPDAPEWLETPALDRLAKEGAHLANAFVRARPNRYIAYHAGAAAQAIVRRAVSEIDLLNVATG